MQSRIAPVLFTLASTQETPAWGRRRHWRTAHEEGPLCLVFNRDLTNDELILKFFDIPQIKYLLRDTGFLFLSITRSANAATILWPNPEEIQLVSSQRNLLDDVVQLIFAQRTDNGWQITRRSSKQFLDTCKRMQRQIGCVGCPKLPCVVERAKEWLKHTVPITLEHTPETIWNTWLHEQDEVSTTKEKIVWLQKGIGAGKNAHFEFISPADTTERPFQRSIRSPYDHWWENVDDNRKRRKERVAYGQETKRLIKEQCSLCIFESRCECHWVRHCTRGPCTKDKIQQALHEWLKNTEIKNREELSFIANISGTEIRHVFRSPVIVGRMDETLTAVKLRHVRGYSVNRISYAELLVLLQAEYGRDWVNKKLSEARETPMSDEALAMYLEFCQIPRWWPGLQSGFGNTKKIQSVQFLGDVRFDMDFTHGGMRFDGFGSLWNLKRCFTLWDRERR